MVLLISGIMKSTMEKMISKWLILPVGKSEDKEASQNRTIEN